MLNRKPPCSTARRCQNLHTATEYHSAAARRCSAMRMRYVDDQVQRLYMKQTWDINGFYHPQIEAEPHSVHVLWRSHICENFGLAVGSLAVQSGVFAGMQSERTQVCTGMVTLTSYYNRAENEPKRSYRCLRGMRAFANQGPTLGLRPSLYGALYNLFMFKASRGLFRRQRGSSKASERNQCCGALRTVVHQQLGRQLAHKTAQGSRKQSQHVRLTTAP